MRRNISVGALHEAPLRFCLATFLLALALLPALLFAQEGEGEAEITLTPTPDGITCEMLAPVGGGANAAFYFGIGDAYTQQGNYARAIVAYTCGLDLTPDYAAAYISRGLAHAAQFNVTQALEDYNRALELDANLTAAYLNRGLLYSQQANYALAIADFTLVTALTPDFAPAFHNRALVHAAEGNYDLAIADLQQALTIDPEYAASHETLGAVYLALAAQSYGDYESVVGRSPVNSAADMLTTLQDRLAIGDSSVWLTLQTPAR